MSVRIRLSRAGRKKIPHYRIVVMDSRNRRDGAYIEKIGKYDPRHQPPLIEVAEDRALHWLRQGAVPSDTVRSLLSKHGIMLRFDLTKRNTPAERVDETVSRWKEQASAREARRAQLKSQRRKKKETAQPEAAPAEPTPSA
ncbi:30S ribosomal protein S16 [bacterium]|nr:30S ribosomal protein S16 [bacterium]MBU1982786.1 30S ribosomal protein S16 [bacterium]